MVTIFSLYSVDQESIYTTGHYTCHAPPLPANIFITLYGMLHTNLIIVNLGIDISYNCIRTVAAIDCNK